MTIQGTVAPIERIFGQWSKLGRFTVRQDLVLKEDNFEGGEDTHFLVDEALGHDRPHGGPEGAEVVQEFQKPVGIADYLLVPTKKRQQWNHTY